MRVLAGAGVCNANKLIRRRFEMLIVMTRMIGIAIAIIFVLCAINVAMEHRLLGVYSKAVPLFGLGCLAVFIVLQIIRALVSR